MWRSFDWLLNEWGRQFKRKRGGGGILQNQKVVGKKWNKKKEKEIRKNEGEEGDEQCPFENRKSS